MSTPKDILVSIHVSPNADTSNNAVAMLPHQLTQTSWSLRVADKAVGDSVPGNLGHIVAS
jgi:hypothetical protein